MHLFSLKKIKIFCTRINYVLCLTGIQAPLSDWIQLLQNFQIQTSFQAYYLELKIRKVLSEVSSFSDKASCDRYMFLPLYRDANKTAVRKIWCSLRWEYIVWNLLHWLTWLQWFSVEFSLHRVWKLCLHLAIVYLCVKEITFSRIIGLAQYTVLKHKSS